MILFHCLQCNHPEWGHNNVQACHSFCNNAVFCDFEHPRFGRIMAIKVSSINCSKYFFVSTQKHLRLEPPFSHSKCFYYRLLWFGLTVTVSSLSTGQTNFLTSQYFNNQSEIENKEREVLSRLGPLTWLSSVLSCRPLTRPTPSLLWSRRGRPFYDQYRICGLSIRICGLSIKV